MLFVLPYFARSGTRRACRKVRALESGSPVHKVRAIRTVRRYILRQLGFQTCRECVPTSFWVRTLSVVAVRIKKGCGVNLCCGSEAPCIAATNVTRPQVLWFWWGNGHENRFQSFSARFNARSAGGIALLKNRTGKAMPSFKIWFLISLVGLPIAFLLFLDIVSGYWFIQRQFIWTMPLFGVFLAWSAESTLRYFVTFPNLFDFQVYFVYFLYFFVDFLEFILIFDSFELIWIIWLV